MGVHSSSVELHAPQRLTNRSLFRILVGGVGLGAVALAIVASPAAAGLPAGLARALGVALPVGFGLGRLLRHRDDRFALLLVGAGALWSLTTLAQSASPGVYSIGRLAVWLIEPVLIYLLLAFPRGRLASLGERRLVWAAVLTAGLLYVPTAFLAPFPDPNPFTVCATTCPRNAFLAVSAAPGVIDDVIRPLREVLTVLIFGAVAVVLARRMARSGEVMRRILGPVVVVAAVRTVALGAYLIERRNGPATGLVDALGWAYVLSLPALTLAFAGGVLAHRLFVAAALEQLTTTLSSRPGPRRLRAALAGALRDPTLVVLYAVPDGPDRWIDDSDGPVAAPADGAGRSVTFVGRGRPAAAVVHDADLDLDPALLEGVSAYVAAALQNRRLVDRLRDSLADLADSRARIVAAADDERRRIERDLHDGAQQRLVALQINLELLAVRLDLASPDDARRVRALEDEIDITLDEVRRFGRGLYPPLLAERGLGDALRGAARGAALPATVDVRLEGRYPTSTESAVYFSCVEALQNAVKHARGATAVHIRVTGDDRLRFEVADDGAGFDPATTPEGTGLTNLRDRIEALGGSLQLDSARGDGTRVTGVVPAPSRSRPVPDAG